VKTILILTLAWGLSFAAPVFPQDTPAFEVVREYVRQLAITQAAHETTSSELAQSKDLNSKNMAMIRGSTRIQLELRRNIAAFKAMSLSGDFVDLLPTFIGYYEKKVELHSQLIDIATQFASTPKPDVDYGRLAAVTPQISATIDYIDRAMFEATPMFCLLAVDRKADTEGKLSHLLLSSAERKQLIRRLDSAFGKRLREKNPNYTVGAAVLIRDFLAGKHKSSDDPWD
jgi:hypothetical protein